MASLGAISTILASYLAKVRGSGEPEFSTIHARELNTFLRDIEAFIMDHGPYFIMFVFPFLEPHHACLLLDSILRNRITARVCVCVCVCVQVIRLGRSRTIRY